jgi:hypothetical protein
MYKSVALGWAYCIHSIFVKFAGKVPFAPFIDATYAPLTSWSVALLLAFEEDVDDRSVLASSWKAQYYDFGRCRLGLNFIVFTKWMLTASVHGIVCWSIPIVLLSLADRENQTLRFWKASYLAFTVLLITVHLKLILVMNWFCSNNHSTEASFESDMSERHRSPTTISLPNSFGAQCCGQLRTALRRYAQRVEFKFWPGVLAWWAELLSFALGSFVLGWLASKKSRHAGGQNAFIATCSECQGNEDVPWLVLQDRQMVSCLVLIPVALLVFDTATRGVKRYFRLYRW